uniref:Interleukin 34 n=1 Tax=Anas zonorhyncha TaxID=75864 RepID=A0A8B9V7B8_9AVES
MAWGHFVGTGHGDATWGQGTVAGLGDTVWGYGMGTPCGGTERGHTPGTGHGAIMSGHGVGIGHGDTPREHGLGSTWGPGRDTERGHGAVPTWGHVGRGPPRGDAAGGTLHGDTASLTPPPPWQVAAVRGPPPSAVPCPPSPVSPVPCPPRAMQAVPPPAPTVTMHQGYAAVLCVLAVLRLEAAALGECELARLLRDQLGYEKRLQYTKHYFPVGYTLRVQYEEVLRPANITRLRAGAASEASLRYLWFHVSAQAVRRLHQVLPEQHPSWPYTRGLGRLLDALGTEHYGHYRQSEVAAAVAELVQRLHSGERRPKAVRPKALLDNCLRVLRMLFQAPCQWGATESGGEEGSRRGGGGGGG